MNRTPNPSPRGLEPRSGMASGPARGLAIPVHDAERGTSLLFAGYLALVLMEYLGLASEIGVLKALHFTTLLSYALMAAVIVRSGFSAIVSDRQSKLMLALFALTVLSVFYAYVQFSAFSTIRPFIDAFILFAITYILVDRQSRIDMLAIVCALAAVLLCARNADKLGSSTREGGFLAPYFLSDGNDFAWGMNVLLPITAILVIGRRRFITRSIGVVGCATCVLGIVGTQSRGATIALGAAFLYWLGVSKRKMLGALTVVLVVIGVLVIAPSQYFNRLESIGEYQEDNSARARLDAWGSATRMAIHNPLGVGAGNFNSAYGRLYRPDAMHARIEWGEGRWLSAHSVYFKVLGEYGFPGIVLFLGIIVTNFLDNLRSRRQLVTAADGAPVSDYWPMLLNMSLIGYAVNGVFLGGFLYPHLFLITALTLRAKRFGELAAATADGTAAVVAIPEHPGSMTGRSVAQGAPAAGIAASFRYRSKRFE